MHLLATNELDAIFCYRFWVSKYPHGEGYPGGTRGEEPACQCRRCGLSPWVGKIPLRRAWQPTPVFLPRESHGQRSMAGYSPWGRRVGCDAVTEHVACGSSISPLGLDSAFVTWNKEQTHTYRSHRPEKFQMWSQLNHLMMDPHSFQFLVLGILWTLVFSTTSVRLLANC